MDEVIRHEGIVLSVEGRFAKVKIIQTSGCAACKAKNMCMTSEMRETFAARQRLPNYAPRPRFPNSSMKL